MLFAVPTAADGVEDRITALEEAVKELQDEVAELKGSAPEASVESAAATAVSAESESASADPVQGGFVLGESKYSITAIKAYTLDSFESYGDTYTPQEGNQFLCVEFDAENISDEENYLNRYDFDAYCDGYQVEQLEDCPEDFNVLTGDIARGKHMRGGFIYEVPSDWAEFEIGFTEEYDGPRTSIVITPGNELFNA